MRGEASADKKVEKFNFYRDFFHLRIGSWEKEYVMVPNYPAYVYDTADSMEVHQSIMTFVVQCNRNLNYLCPFLVTETCIDNRWVCSKCYWALPNGPKHSRNNKEANHMTFLRRVKFVSCPHVSFARMRSFRFWSYLSFLSRLSRRSCARRQRYANYFRVCIDNSLLCLSIPWHNCSDNNNCSDCFTIPNKCKPDRLANSTKLETLNSRREKREIQLILILKF